MLIVTMVHEHGYKIIVEHDLLTLPNKNDVQYLIFNRFLNTEFVNLSCMNPAFNTTPSRLSFPRKSRHGTRAQV